MFVPSWLPRAFGMLTVLLLVIAVGCQRQADADAKSEASAKTRQVTVDVTGMSCEKGCAPRAKEALATLPWAKNVKVDFEKKQATFVAEAASYDEKAIITALEKEGFGGSVAK